MTLKEKALEAWAQKQREDTAYHEEQRKQLSVTTLSLAMKVFGEDVAIDIVDGNRFTVNGLEFRRASGEGNSWLELKGECLTCGLETWSSYIFCLADLGQLLDGFTPRWTHHCPESEPEILPDVATRIAIALERIADHLTWEK